MSRTKVPRIDRVAAVLLFVLLLVRLAAAVVVAPDVQADAQGYGAAAYRLATTGSFAYPLMNSGHWTTEGGSLKITDQGRQDLLGDSPNAYVMPGYPAFRAMVLRLAGDRQTARLYVRILQAIMSVLRALLLYLIALRFGRRTALLALAGAALYLPLTLANSYLLTEVLFSVLLLASVALLLAWSDSLSPSRALIAGLVFGASLLVRPTFAPWAVIACLIVIVGSPDKRRSALIQSAIVGLAIIAVMSPWWIRNYELYGKPVLFSTSGPVTSIEAVRMDVAEKLPFPWAYAPPAQTAAEREIEARIDAIYAGRPTVVDDMVLHDYYSEKWGELRATLAREYGATAALARARSFAVSLFWPNAVSPTAAGGAPFLFTWVFRLLIVALCALGIAVAPRRKDTALLGSLMVFALVIHLILIPFHRYYFPVMPVAILFAAIGAGRLADIVRTRTRAARSDYGVGAPELICALTPATIGAISGTVSCASSAISRSGSTSSGLPIINR